MKQRFDHVRYDFALFEVSFSESELIPKMPGIYVLFDNLSLYCGGCGDLRKRVQESISEQRLGDRIFFFPVSTSWCSNGILAKDLVDALERACIAALYTIIRGQGLPFMLTNKMHVAILPELAWAADSPDELALSISIAQTVLYSVGLPRCLIELPFLPLAMSGFPAKLAAENAPLWPSIYATEREARKNPNHPRSPMFVVHPAPL